MTVAILIVTYLLLAIESPLLYHLDLSFYAPDVALITALFYSTRLSVVKGALVCFALGMLKDAYSLGSPLGMYTEITVVLYFLMRFFSAQLSMRAAVPLMGMIFLASIASSLFFLVLSAIFDRSFEAYGLVLRMMAPQALVTAPFAPILFWLYARVERLTVRKRSPGIFFG